MKQSVPIYRQVRYKCVSGCFGHLNKRIVATKVGGKPLSPADRHCTDSGGVTVQVGLYQIMACPVVIPS